MKYTAGSASIRTQRLMTNTTFLAKIPYKFTINESNQPDTVQNEEQLDEDTTERQDSTHEN